MIYNLKGEALLGNQRVDINQYPNFLGIFSSLWGERVIIGLVTIAVTFLGGLYLLKLENYYEAKVHVLSSSLNKERSVNNEFLDLTPDEVFFRFIEILTSRQYKSEFLRDNEEILERVVFNKFSDEKTVRHHEKLLYFENLLTIEAVRKDPSVFEMVIKGNQLGDAEVILDLYLSGAQNKISKELRQVFIHNKEAKLVGLLNEKESITFSYKRGIKSEIKSLEEEHYVKLEGLRDKLSAYKKAGLKNTEKRLQKLKKAYEVAVLLDIEQPTSMHDLTKSRGGSRVEFLAEINQVETNSPQYLKGSKFLSAEIESLESVADEEILDDSVIAIETEILTIQNQRKIQTLKERDLSQPIGNKRFLEVEASIHTIQQVILPENYLSSFIDGAAISDTEPVIPKKRLMLIIIVGGFLLGVFAAGVMISIRPAEVKV